MAEKVTEFQVVAARGIRFRNSPKFDDVTPGPGPVLGNVLPGYLITVDDRQVCCCLTAPPFNSSDSNIGFVY